MALVMAAAPPSMAANPRMATTPRRTAEDLALDVSRLMDGVREEVTALMQDGVQKTASFCASLCAERVVAARREMQRRWAEERRELERLYGVPERPGTSSASAFPASPAARSGYPPRHRDGASEQQVRTPRSEPPESVSDGQFPPPHMLTKGDSSETLFVSGLLRAAHQQSGGSLVAAARTAGPVNPRLQAAIFDESFLQMSAPTHGASRVAFHMDPSSSDAIAYDATFIDAYDAVQTLEERTNMASRAMDLLDEALQAAAGATATTSVSASPSGAQHAAMSGEAGSVHSFVSCSPPQNSGIAPALYAHTPISVSMCQRHGPSGGGAPPRANRPSEGCQLPRARRVEPNGNTEYIPPFGENGSDAATWDTPSLLEREQHSSMWQPVPISERERTHRDGSRAVFRERSVASISSGGPSLAAADVHGN